MFKIIFNDMYKEMDLYKCYDIDVEDLQNTFSNFKLKLHNLENINEGDKIYFDDSNVIQITPSGYLQCATRWYNSYNRHEIFTLLHNLINEYFQFCDMLSYYKKHIYLNKVDYLFNKTYNDVYSYLSKIIIGIEKLKNTYYDDESIRGKFRDLISLITNKFILKNTDSSIKANSEMK